MSGIKAFARLYGRVRALPHRVRHLLGRWILGPEKAFLGASERISRIPGHTGVYARQAFYRSTLASVGVDVYLGYLSVFSKAGVSLGDRVYVGRFCSIGLADIGDDVRIADGVQILSGRHQHGSSADATLPEESRSAEFTRVTIGAGAWLGAGAVVMADVGPGAIVGAGAVVTKPVPGGAAVAGVPAKEIRSGAEAEPRHSRV